MADQLAPVHAVDAYQQLPEPLGTPENLRIHLCVSILAQRSGALPPPQSAENSHRQARYPWMTVLRPASAY